MNVTFDATAFTKDMDRLITEAEAAALEEFEATATEIQTAMRVVGKPVEYPIQWDSEKQKRYVIAKLAAAGNLPYRRTNKYVNGWTIMKFPEGVELVNKSPAGAVGGIPSTGWQSKIFEGRWPKLLTVLMDKLEGMVTNIIDNLTARMK